jgi:uncharacterized lipoprotein YddW (UPF0748 family)
MSKKPFAALIATATLAIPCMASADVSASPNAPAPIAAARPELRAFWVDGFNDGYKTPEQCDALMERLRATHCNAVFVQMRKRADSYYVSHYEPWALDDPERFDALAYLCKLAHEPGKPYIQVHAWMNACAVGGNKSPDSLTKLHPDWFSTSDGGVDYDNESTKIDPGNPAAADWTYRVYMDVVRHYAVDGIHLDFIRYGGTGKSVGHWGYNPASVARFNAQFHRTGQPAWNDPDWREWRRDQVTALVRRVSVSAHSLRPEIIVSAATICWGAPPADDAAYEAKSASYTEVFAPWRDWLRDGLLDLNCPMTYMNTTLHRPWWTGWSEFVKSHQYGRLSTMGIGAWMNAVPQSMWQIADARTLAADGHPAAGAVIFSYAGTDTTDHQERQYSPEFYTALGAPGLWDTDVAAPEMPWLSHPTTGAIMGTELNADLTARDGAVVSIESVGGSVTRKAVADGNGFYAVMGLPPGRYIVSDGGYWIKNVHVIAGDVQTISSPVPPERKVFGVGRLADGVPVVLSDALVTSGSGRHGDAGRSACTCPRIRLRPFREIASRSPGSSGSMAGRRRSRLRPCGISARS